MTEPKTGAGQKTRSIGRATRAGVMWAYLRSIVSLIVMIPTTVVLARLLTPSDFGIAAVATFFGQLASKLSNAGVGIALVRVKDLKDEHISSVFVINLALTVVCAVALIASGPAIASFYRTPELVTLSWLVALDFVIGSLSMVSQALLTRDMRYKEMAAISTAEMTATSVGAAVFAFLGFKYWSLVLGAVCGSAVKWIWGGRAAGWHVSLRYVHSSAKELMSFALGTYTKGMLEYLSQNVDNLVIGRVLGVEPLGLYDKAFSSVQRVFKKLTVIGPSVSFRALAIMQDEHERFRRAFDKIMVTSSFVSYVVFAGMAAAAPNLILLLFGKQWLASIVPFQLLCAAGALKISNVYGGAAANARGWIWSNVWRQAAQTICIVVGVYLAAPWGVNGASAAVLGATIIMFVLTQTLLRDAVQLDWGELLSPHIPGAVLALGLVLVEWSVDVSLRGAGRPVAVILAAQAVAGGLVTLFFVRWSPFGSVRRVVHEIVGDMSPRVARLLAGSPNDSVVNSSAGASTQG